MTDAPIFSRGRQYVIAVLLIALGGSFLLTDIEETDIEKAAETPSTH